MIKNNNSVQRHVKDTLIHKELFTRSCRKMVMHLYDLGRDEDALKLARRCIIHDNSKLENDEIGMFSKIPTEDMECNKPHGELCDDDKKLIALHWSRNSHHPEFFDDYHQMEEVDIIEMCCDWHSRTIQFGTELIPYLLNTQRKRFGFDDEFFAKILEYCEFLNND